MKHIAPEHPVRRGIMPEYHGDIVTGPFITYGAEHEDKSMFQKVNDRYKHRSYDLTFKNLEAMLANFAPPKNEGEVLQDRIHFLPVDSCEKLHNKSKFLDFFHLMYIGTYMAQKLTSDLVKMLAPGGNIMCEKTR